MLGSEDKKGPIKKSTSFITYVKSRADLLHEEKEYF
jgi:hypothetical protein